MSPANLRPASAPTVALAGLAGHHARAVAVAAMSRDFAAAGLDTPALDARMLIQGVLGIDAAEYVLRPDVPLGLAAGPVRAAALRRLQREPVSRIIGRRGFFGLEFEIGPDTLDPRPETETLVDLVLELVDRSGWRQRPLRILDYGTGTGCVLLSILHALPRAVGVGSDVSEGALRMARANADRLGLSARVRWCAADGLQPLRAVAPFDVVVSNPPYIASADLDRLAPEVARYDPALALDGGLDGLCHYRRLATDAAALAPQGWVAVEVGAGQASAVEQLVRSEAISVTEVTVVSRRDLAGHVRCVAWQPQFQER